MPENKELSSERQTEPFGSDEPHMYGGDQNWSEDAVRTASPDLSGAQENDGAADLVGTSPSDSFEQNTTYVRTEEPSEESQTMEQSSQSEEEPFRQADRSEEQLNRQAGKPEGEQYRQAGRPEGEQYRQTGGSGEEQYRQTGRNEQEPYRQDGGRNADWRSRASRTNDTNGSFDSAEGRNVTATALRILRTADLSIHRIPVFRKNQRSRLPEKSIKTENADGSRRESRRACSQLRSSCSLASVQRS